MTEKWLPWSSKHTHPVSDLTQLPLVFVVRALDSVGEFLKPCLFLMLYTVSELNQHTCDCDLRPMDWTSVSILLHQDLPSAS